MRRRRLTAHGIQPVDLVQHAFEWCYVYRAVAPTTGERFVLALPSLNAEALPIFVDTFAHTFPDSLNILLLDNRGAYTAQRLQWPANARYGRLPPCGPELNPIDRLWRELQDDLTWLYCPNLDAQLVYVGDL